MKKSLLPLPLVFWETTTACNLECVHCRRADFGEDVLPVEKEVRWNGCGGVEAA